MNKRATLKTVIKRAAGGAALAIGSIALAATPASAEESGRFACDPGFYQVISGQLASFNPANGEYINIGLDRSNYNAMGYRIADGLLYGIAGKNLLQINAEGIVNDLGPLPLSSSGGYTGDFGDDGLLHISKGGRDWHKVDVETMQATPVPQLSQYKAVADITNVHGAFYGVSSAGELFKYDPAALTVTSAGNVAGLPSSLKAYGAAWATAGGNLYVGRNSGEIYQVIKFTSGSPEAIQVGSATPTNSNDGASCELAPAPAGLNDHDGPEPETEPKTPEAIAATEWYIENYEEISQTYETYEETPNQDSAEVTQGSEATSNPKDAGLGEGDSCGDVKAENMNPRDGVQLSSATPGETLFRDDFNAAGFSELEFLAGEWSISNGLLTQIDDCGFDLAAIVPEYQVANYKWSADITDIAGSNGGGLLIHQSSAHTRSGATLVDFHEGGALLRYGYYDNLGYYTEIGRVENPGFVAGETQNLSVEVVGSKVAASVNGQLLAEFEAKNESGLVGLVSSASAVSFDNVTLIAR